MRCDVRAPAAPPDMLISVASGDLKPGRGLVGGAPERLTGRLTDILLGASRVYLVHVCGSRHSRGVVLSLQLHMVILHT